MTKTNSALEWLRSKLEFSHSEQFVLMSGPDAGRTVQSNLYTYRGNLPARMVYQLKGAQSLLIKEEMVQEYLRLGGQYRSDFGKCEFHKTVYEFVN